jgi:hypothetical protein
VVHAGKTSLSDGAECVVERGFNEISQIRCKRSVD